MMFGQTGLDEVTVTQHKHGMRIVGALAVVAFLAPTAAGQVPDAPWSLFAACPKSPSQFTAELLAYDRKVTAHFEALDASVLQSIHDRSSNDGQSQALRLFAPFLIPKRNAFDTRCWALLHGFQRAIDKGALAGPEMRGWLACLAQMEGGEQNVPPLARAVQRCHSKLVGR